MLDEGDEIRFSLRVDSPELRAADWPPEILTLPQREKVYRELHPARPCPRCAAQMSTVRDLGGTMICGTCGRSFKAWTDI